MKFTLISLLFIMTTGLNEKLIFDFDNSASVQDWRIINDGVMGGLSSSTIKCENGVAIFSGIVSLENNGGFASVRTMPQDFNLKNKKGILLRIKGDGKKYKFRIRTNENFDGVAYSMDFNTINNKWEEIKLPFDQLYPTFRGRVLKNVEPLKSENIRQVGYLIGDKQTGSFVLEIDWIKAY